MNSEIPATTQRTSKMAVISLGSGLIGLTTPFWTGLSGEALRILINFSIGATAFTLGGISLYRIGKRHDLKGRGMAIGGLVTGGAIGLYYFGLGLAFLTLGPG